MTGADESLALRYREHRFSRDAVKVLPGGYAVDADGLLMVTTLGSCVAACLWDPRRGIGGINHFLLPGTERDAPAPLDDSARYGTHAMELLFNALMKAGARRAELRAKVFGGSNVLASVRGVTVGARNAGFVRAFLRTEGVPVDAEDLGGRHPRKVHFFPDSGRVMVRQLPMDQQQVAEVERRYRDTLERTPDGGSVELF